MEEQEKELLELRREIAKLEKSIRAMKNRRQEMVNRANAIDHELIWGQFYE